jgi:hypothetical protein
MATKQKSKVERKPAAATGAADGWQPVNDEAPQQLDLEVGEVIEGVMGPVKQGKYNRYRILSTQVESSKGSHEPGRFFLQGASLERLMDFPAGSMVRLKYTGEKDVGKGNPMRDYQKAVKPAAEPMSVNGDDGQDDLPF